MAGRKLILSNKNFRQQSTNEEVLQRAFELDVKEAPIYASLEDEFNMGTARIKGWKALLRQDGTPFIAVKEGFTPKNHSEIIQQTMAELDKTGLNYYPVSFTANESPGRNALSVRYAFPDITFETMGSDTVTVLNIINGNDMNTSFMSSFGFWRMVCTNGLIAMTKALASINKKHTQSIGKVQIGDYVSEAIHQIQNEIPDFTNLLEKAGTIKVNDQLKKLLQETLKLSDNQLIELPIMVEKYRLEMNEPFDIDTVLGQYQVLTNWLTNKVEPRDVSAAQNGGLKLLQYLNKAVDEFYQPAVAVGQGYMTRTDDVEL